ncbi:MAG TPA: sigma-70 family RNA polymerase sigma factor [Candidatus Hydrogenedentes bacterium]|nr:sigma-70 family RNA polymerase sigma factor [Candidatus Hydrogenedentota bacterium]HPG66977.1 sigma-70 family RNA polymerase sigma factor [Candidatus Hydrogenedentota bacterium]
MTGNIEQNGSKRTKAFENLVLEHMDMLYAVALRLTRNPTDAQDLTQNTVVKALRFHDRFKEGTYIKAWLLTILRNTFINEYRRKARIPAFVELTGAEAAEDKSPDPEVPFEPGRGDAGGLLELLDDEVRHAVETLPEEFRTTVIMADLQERSYKEIAEAVGCPLGTVMSRLHRGRRLLRKELAEYARERRLIGAGNADAD